MSQVAMLLSNAYRPDPRVQRAARSLLQAGHALELYCWDRQAELPEEENQDGLQIHRLKSVPSRYAAGWRQIFRLPRFWRWARMQIERHPAEIVHCHDLDTLYAGVAIKRRTGSRLVYDAHEHYPALMALYLPASLVSLLALWEQILVRQVDQIITASSVLADEYRRNTTLPVAVIGNAPARAEFQNLSPGNTTRSRQGIGLASNQLGVFYIGGFTSNRALNPLFEAMPGLPCWQLHLWGDGPQRAAVETAVAGLENAQFHSWAESAALPGLFAAADVIYYCLRSETPGARYNAPNTLAYAMAAGRPILANRVGDLGRIVAETQCGILLERVTPDAIRDALQRLEDPATRQQLGENGRRAAETQYNWETISRRLIEIYARLSR